MATADSPPEAEAPAQPVTLRIPPHGRATPRDGVVPLAERACALSCSTRELGRAVMGGPHRSQPNAIESRGKHLLLYLANGRCPTETDREDH